MTWTYHRRNVTWSIDKTDVNIGAGADAEFEARNRVTIGQRAYFPLIASSLSSGMVAMVETCQYILRSAAFAYDWLLGIQWDCEAPAGWFKLGYRVDVSCSVRLYVSATFSNGSPDKGTSTPQLVLVTPVGFSGPVQTRQTEWAYVDKAKEVWAIEVVLLGIVQPTKTHPVPSVGFSFDVEFKNGVQDHPTPFPTSGLVSWSLGTVIVDLLSVKDTTTRVSARTQALLDLPTSAPCRRGSV